MKLNMRESYSISKIKNKNWKQIKYEKNNKKELETDIFQNLNILRIDKTRVKISFNESPSKENFALQIK
jgi:hypothetical protein